MDAPMPPVCRAARRMGAEPGGTALLGDDHRRVTIPGAMSRREARLDVHRTSRSLTGPE